MLLLGASALATSGCYLNYDSEFVLTRRQLADAQDFLNTHIQPGDMIVTGRIDAYFYLLYAKNSGKTPYDAYGAVGYFRNTTLMSRTTRLSFPIPIIYPRDSLVSDAVHDHVSPQAKYWFVAYG